MIDEEQVKVVGWICPICEKAISPYEVSCPFCVSKEEQKEIMFWPYKGPEDIVLSW